MYLDFDTFDFGFFSRNFVMSYFDIRRYFKKHARIFTKKKKNFVSRMENYNIYK